MELQLILLLAVTCYAIPHAEYKASSSDGSYSFNFETGEEGGKHSRKETRSAEGVVVGEFSYEDPNGNLRMVEYRADGNGYVARGHVGPEGAPKAELPLYALPEYKADPATETTTKSSEEQKPSTEEPVTDKPNPDEESKDKQAENPGFFVLSLGGKRRLEKPSDTGKLDIPAEEKSSFSYYNPYLHYYPLSQVPYVTDVKELSRPYYLAPVHHHVPYVPYIPTVRNPIIPAKSYFHSYQIQH
ncbi:uncharacterized protein [Centruroides vittatus]|uniref:uncharacterized protein n=1 Tax=Centruroides vittatus TaxID=120091 RepID=UPI00350F2D41